MSSGRPKPDIRGQQGGSEGARECAPATLAACQRDTAAVHRHRLELLRFNPVSAASPGYVSINSIR